MLLEWKEDRVVVVGGRARAHRCLDGGGASSDGGAMHFATRSRAPAYFAAKCTLFSASRHWKELVTSPHIHKALD